MENFMETITENIKQEYLSDFAALLKKMRLLKKLSKQQAGLLFDFSYKYIERLENGRGAISVEKFKEFQEKYGLTDSDVENLRSGKIQASTDAILLEKIKHLIVNQIEYFATVELLESAKI
jgi:transcriptional regulator with XRE-family HTH domain